MCSPLGWHGCKHCKILIALHNCRLCNLIFCCLASHHFYPILSSTTFTVGLRLVWMTKAWNIHRISCIYYTESMQIPISWHLYHQVACWFPASRLPNPILSDVSDNGANLTKNVSPSHTCRQHHSLVAQSWKSTWPKLNFQCCLIQLTVSIWIQETLRHPLKF